MAPIDLCVIADVETWLNVPSLQAGEIAVLARLITSASSMILRETGRPGFLAQSFTERRNGNGAQRMLLLNYPVVSVSSVTVDTVSISQSPDGLKPGWVNDSFSVYILGGSYISPGCFLGAGTSRFRKGIQNVQFVYSAGYSSIPFDISQACIELVGQKYRRRTHIDEDMQLASGMQSIAFSKKDIPPEVLRTINDYTYRAPME